LAPSEGRPDSDGALMSLLEGTSVDEIGSWQRRAHNFSELAALRLLHPPPRLWRLGRRRRIVAMLPGGPATLVLALSTAIGFGIGKFVVSRWGGEGTAKGEHGEQLQIINPAAHNVQHHAIATGVVALVFWAWALQKVLVHGDPDLGVVSFAVVIAASANGYRCGSQREPERMRWQRWFLSGATVLVTLNYLLALVFIPLPGSFQAYLAIGALYWATSGFLGLRLLAALRDSEQVY